MKYNNRGFSIILALWFTLLMSFTWIYLIEYMVPFARNISWIENSSKAFYQSYGALEDSIYRTYEWGVWFAPPANPLATASPVDTAYSVISSGNVIPQAWRGSSPSTSNWNIISQNLGVNLFVGNNAFSSAWRQLRVRFTVPDYDNNGVTVDTLKYPNDIILWQLSDGVDSLSSLDLIDIPANIANMFSNGSSTRWVLLDGVTQQYFSQFYSANCGSWNQCVLRFSIVNPLISNDDGVLPYLQYLITTNGTANLPFQESYISAQWKSYWFKKDLEIVLPRPVTNSAFDFTVLQ